MTSENTNDRLDAALAWASLSHHERDARRYHARNASPISHQDTISKFLSGPTAPVRMNRRLIKLAEVAWPDADVRKREISKLIVIAALDVIQKRLESVFVQ